VFILSGLGKNASFPVGFADPHESEIMTQGGEFIGGQGMVQVRAVHFPRFCQEDF
jgi:hypothetical protein